MNQPTCTCKLLSGGVGIEQCPLCAAAPELYAALMRIKDCDSRITGICSVCRDEMDAALAAARREVQS